MTVKKTNDVLRIGHFESTFDDELTARYEIAQLPDGPQRAGFLTQHAAEFRVVVTSGPPGVDADTIAALPNLEAIVNNGVGVDSIDLEAARRRGIGVSNTPDVLSDTVADTALGLILMTLRRFGAADRYVRAGRWRARANFRTPGMSAAFRSASWAWAALVRPSRRGYSDSIVPSRITTVTE